MFLRSKGKVYTSPFGIKTTDFVFYFVTLLSRPSTLTLAANSNFMSIPPSREIKKKPHCAEILSITTIYCSSLK
jgi:hypothetical protein